MLRRPKTWRSSTCKTQPLYQLGSSRLDTHLFLRDKGTSELILEKNFSCQICCTHSKCWIPQTSRLLPHQNRYEKDTDVNEAKDKSETM